jgi:transcriptional regulator with XRE-family HTH domain
MKKSGNALIPERLAYIRKQLGLTKAEAARRIGLTAASYVRYEAGERNPSPQVILSIAEKMGTSAGFLSGESEDISPDVISIDKASSPLLFELIKNTQSADNATLQRLLNYFYCLKNMDSSESS